MSESDFSRAAGTTPSKEKAPDLTETQRSNKRLFELNRATQPSLVPSDRSPQPPLTRFDAVRSRSQKSPISARLVSLIDRRVHRASMIPTSSHEESAATLAYEKKLMGQRARNAARATRRKKAPTGGAPPRTPSITAATSDEDGSSAVRETEKTESELEERTRDRYDEMGGLVPEEHDPSEDPQWVEEVENDVKFIGSTFD